LQVMVWASNFLRRILLFQSDTMADKHSAMLSRCPISNEHNLTSNKQMTR
jgi:hypothetical protein